MKVMYRKKTQREMNCLASRKTFWNVFKEKCDDLRFSAEPHKRMRKEEMRGEGFHIFAEGVDDRHIREWTFLVL